MFSCKLIKDETISSKLKTQEKDFNFEVDSILSEIYFKIKNITTTYSEDINKYLNFEYTEESNLGNIYEVDLESISCKKGTFLSFITNDQLINMNTVSILDYLADKFDEVILFTNANQLTIWIQMTNNEIKNKEEYRIAIPINLEIYIEFVMIILSNLYYLLCIIGPRNWKCKPFTKELYKEYEEIINNKITVSKRI